MKMLFKKNQVIIYVIALMLVVAGYLNYTSNGDLDSAVQVSSSEEELAKMANIGDAQLVSSNVIDEDNSIQNSVSDIKNDVVENSIEENDIKNSAISSNEIDVNTTITTSSNNSKDNKNNTNYFSTSKLERDTMYSQMIETYEKILNSTNSLETQKQSASEEIAKINNIKNSIMICENLIKTKGFENSVIFVNGDSISIIVEDEQLTKEEVAQIQNIISREMNAKVENIHISSK